MTIGVIKSHARCKEPHAVVMVNHPSTFYSLIVINTHSSFIRGHRALFSFECGVFIRRAFLNGTGSHGLPKLPNAYLLKEKEISYVELIINFIYIYIYLSSYFALTRSYFCFLFFCALTCTLPQSLWSLLWLHTM